MSSKHYRQFDVKIFFSRKKMQIARLARAKAAFVPPRPVLFRAMEKRPLYLAVSSWFQLESQGMDAPELLSRSSATLVKADALRAQARRRKSYVYFFFFFFFVRFLYQISTG
jgi:hypothetical protein